MSTLDTDAIAQRLDDYRKHGDPILGGDIAALLAAVATLKREYDLLMESHQGMANENLRLGEIVRVSRLTEEPK